MERVKDIEILNGKIERVVFEMSLKPFKDRNFKEKCEEILEKWESMIKIADRISILLWVGNGSEIIEWDGKYNKEINWARYIGFCNLDYGAYPPEIEHYKINKAALYEKNPLKITYKDLKKIIYFFKKIAKEKYKKKLTVGIPFDPGPEFVHDKFRYLEHTEILKGGPKSEYNTCWFVCSWSKIRDVKEKLKGFPEGIKGEIPFGEFLGKQFYHFAKDMNVDYIWFSNGFGFSHYAWYYKGEIFDGEKFNVEKIPDIEEKIISFWKYFRKYWKGEIEIRGTNYAMGLDISKDAINYKRIYKEGKLDVIPPNTPWGSRDMGGEICIYLTRLAEIPEKRIPIRFYINDPWFRSNPWWDYYGREPYDIYLPMMAGRINERGEIEKFKEIEFLTIDTEKGEVSKKQAEEVYYHIKRGIEFSPDEPGPVLWIYPFDEYHEVLKNPIHISHLYFGDSFISRCISNGFPLNTVISSKNFKKLYKKNPDYFKNIILLTHLPLGDWDYIYDVVDFVKEGGNVIFYGSFAPVKDDIRKIFNVKIEEGLDGDFEIENKLIEDTLSINLDRKFYHNSVFGGGWIGEIIEEGEKVILRKNGKKRTFVSLINYGKGKIGWIRGSLPYKSERFSYQPHTLSPSEYYEPCDFLRYLLSEFGYVIKFWKYVNLQIKDKKDSVSEISVSTITSSISRSPAILISRKKNGYVIGGIKPNNEVEIYLRFPEGIPLPTEREVVMEKDKLGKYNFDKTFLFEVRFFVEQKEESVFQTKELPKEFGYEREISISGLKNATLTVYPEDVKKCIFKMKGKPVEVEKCLNYVKKGGLNGEIEVLW
jgi:hypothetical protein